MTTPFIVLSSQRTGSKYLEQCLNSHPNINCSGEILLGYGGHYKKLPPKALKKYRRARTLWQAIASGAMLFPKHFIDTAFSPEGEDVTAAGFRLMYNQIDRDPRVLPHIQSTVDLKVVHLFRQNLLKQFVSLKLMHDQAKHGRFQAHSFKSSKAVKINVPPHEAIRFIQNVIEAREKHELSFSKFPIMRVNYEDIVSADKGEIIKKEIASFLGAPQLSMKSDQVKMNPSSLHEYVTNMDEISQVFKENGFTKYLEMA